MKQETKVIDNVRSEDLQKVITDWKAGGWRLHSYVPVSGPGLIGVTFTVVFERDGK